MLTGYRYLDIYELELYQHLLGVKAPWTMFKVNLDMQSQEMHEIAEHPRGTKFGCPDCQKQYPATITAMKAFGDIWVVVTSRLYSKNEWTTS